MKKHSFLYLFLFLYLTGCEEGCLEGESDLFWNDIQDIYNPCIGQTQYGLNVSHFFWVNNLNNPNYPPQVLLYYDDQSEIFTDCLGFEWFIAPGSFLVSNRYMANKTGGKTAKSPSAQSYVTVHEANGQVHESSGGAVVFNDIAPGQSVTVPTTIAIDYNNSKYVSEYRADPPDEIAESDESNNVSSDDFSRSSSSSVAVGFTIRMPSEEDLAKIKTRYIIFRNGIIEVHN